MAGLSLTERELAVLQFEKRRFRLPALKEQAIRDEFDLSTTRYYQLLNRLLDNPLALAAEPMLINRLRNAKPS